MLVFDVLLEVVVSWTLFGPSRGGAAEDILGLALGVALAKASPLAKLLVAFNLDEGNLVDVIKPLRPQPTTVSW